MHKTFAMVFDCNYGGDIDACDKDCKTLGYCKRRQQNPPPERMPGETLSGMAGERFESSPEGSGASQPEQPSGPRVSAAPAPERGTTPSDAVKALLSYEQADMDGVFVKVSRQAIHMVVDELSSAQEQIAALTNRAEQAELDRDMWKAEVRRTTDDYSKTAREEIARADKAEAQIAALREVVKMQDGPPIPRYLAEVVYAGYSAVFGSDQSLDRIVERGGFGWGEVEVLWKKPAARKAMSAALAATRKEEGNDACVHGVSLRGYCNVCDASEVG